MENTRLELLRKVAEMNEHEVVGLLEQTQKIEVEVKKREDEIKFLNTEYKKLKNKIKGIRRDTSAIEGVELMRLSKKKNIKALGGGNGFMSSFFGK